VNHSPTPAATDGPCTACAAVPNADGDGALRRELAARNRLIEEFRALLEARERERGALLAQLQVVEQALLAARWDAQQHARHAEDLAHERSAIAARMEAQQAQAQAVHEQRRQEVAWLHGIIAAREQEQLALQAATQQLSTALRQAEAERDQWRWQIASSVVLPRGSVAGRLVRVLRFGKRAGTRLARLSRRSRRPAPHRRSPPRSPAS